METTRRVRSCDCKNLGMRPQWLLPPSAWRHSLPTSTCPNILYFKCVQKSVEERAFTRKDHLKQHIQRVHQKGGNGKPKDIEDILKEWERQAPPLGLNSPALHCGFCGIRFREWESR